MATDVRNCLGLLLLSQLFGLRLLLLLLLQFEALCCSFELSFINDKEVAGAALGEIRLRQDVLHTGDRAHLALLIDVLQLMHLIGLIDDTISFFKMNQFVRLLTVVEDIAKLLSVALILSSFRV